MIEAPSPSEPAPPRITRDLALIIATTGRSEIVSATLDSLLCRETLPELIYIVALRPEDLPSPQLEPPVPIFYLVSPRKGLTAQRNHGLDSLPVSVQIVAYLDDDVEVHDRYFAEVAATFAKEPAVGAFSGCVIANGQIDRSTARNLLDRTKTPLGMPPFGRYPSNWQGMYGCTMNIRRTTLATERFDESLPLYALGEDVEIGFRLSRHGLVGGSARCMIVHLASQSGRIREAGVGYAQVTNFLYFARKGIGYSYRHLLFTHLPRILLSNVLYGIAPNLRKRRQIDYRGRLRGNLVAIKDILLGRSHPRNLVSVLSAPDQP